MVDDNVQVGDHSHDRAALVIVGHRGRFVGRKLVASSTPTRSARHPPAGWRLDRLCSSGHALDHGDGSPGRREGPFPGCSPVGGQHERVYVTMHGEPSVVLLATEDLGLLEGPLKPRRRRAAAARLRGGARRRRGRDPRGPRRGHGPRTQSAAVTDEQDAYLLAIALTARGQHTDHLPRTVAAAAYESIVGRLLDAPQRVGTRLGLPLIDRHSARGGRSGGLPHRRRHPWSPSSNHPPQ